MLLRVHGEAVSSGGSALAVGEAVAALRRAQGESWGRLKESLHANLCLLSFFCRTQA